MNLPNLSKRAIPALLASLSLLLLAATQPAFAGTPVDKTVAAAANGNVHIASVAGTIKVVAWDRNQVHVTGTLSSQAKRLDVESTASGVDIRVVLPEHSRGNDDGSDLVVQVPATSRLGVNTVSADIAAQGVNGSLDLDSVSGNIKAQSASADIATKTVSGDIAIDGSANNAQINVNDISGRVSIGNVHGTLHVESVSGDIRIAGSNTLSGAQLSATSGNIEFAGALVGSGNYAFNSVSGDVKLQLSAIPAARFDASSFSGDIDTNFGPKPQRTSEFAPGKTWNYQSGSGTASVRIHTLSGDIRVQAPAR